MQRLTDVICYRFCACKAPAWILYEIVDEFIHAVDSAGLGRENDTQCERILICVSDLDIFKVLQAATVLRRRDVSGCRKRFHTRVADSTHAIFVYTQQVLEFASAAALAEASARRDNGRMCSLKRRSLDTLKSADDLRHASAICARERRRATGRVCQKVPGYAMSRPPNKSELQMRFQRDQSTALQQKRSHMITSFQVTRSTFLRCRARSDLAVMLHVLCSVADMGVFNGKCAARSPSGSTVGTTDVAAAYTFLLRCDRNKSMRLRIQVLLVSPSARKKQSVSRAQ